MKQIQPTVRIRDGLVTILSLTLAGVFLGTGIGKVIGYSEMVGDFARWGYPEWLVVVAAALEITGALLLLVPRLATVGAGLLAISMSGAFLTHLVNGQAGKGLLTATLFALVVLVGASRWPRSILRPDFLQSGTRPASQAI